MKSALLIAISILIVWMVWNLLRGIVFTIVGIAFQVALLALFCWAVYAVYRAFTRQKIT